MSPWRWWPWYVGLGWLVGYEIYAIVDRPLHLPAAPTLSQLVWWAYDRSPLVAVLGLLLLVALALHFFILHRRRRP
jgi:hypothetical protein